MRFAGWFPNIKPFHNRNLFLEIVQLDGSAVLI